MLFKKAVIDLYEVKQKGLLWDRVQRRARSSERVLQEALQSPHNLSALRLADRHVHWVGREFKSADFFGIDANWNLIVVETKISSQQKHLASQLRRRVSDFLGKPFAKVDEKIWRYIKSGKHDEHLMAEGTNLKKQLDKGNLQGPKDVEIILKARIGKKRPAKVGRVRFVAVVPILRPKFAQQLQKLQFDLKRGGKSPVVFSCVLVTPYFNNKSIAVAHIQF